MVDPNGMLEENEAGELVLTKLGEGMKEIWNDSLVEAVGDKIDARHDELVETIDAYMEQEIVPTIEESVEDSVAEIRKLMLLAVHTIAGPAAVKAFIDKIAAEARAGALSASSGAWAQGGPADASQNRDTVRGGSGTLRKEDVEAAEALEIFNEVSAGLSEDDQELMKELCQDLTYSLGEASKFRDQLTRIRNQEIPNPLTESVVDVISRTIRR